MFIYPFLYRVGLTDGSLCSRDTASDAAVALTHAPEFAADFLCVSMRGEAKQEKRGQRKTKSQECFYINSLQRHGVDLLTPLSTVMSITHGATFYCVHML